MAYKLPVIIIYYFKKKMNTKIKMVTSEEL